jgi:hypothetical protein
MKSNSVVVALALLSTFSLSAAVVDITTADKIEGTVFALRTGAAR